MWKVLEIERKRLIFHSWAQPLAKQREGCFNSPLHWNLSKLLKLAWIKYYLLGHNPSLPGVFLHHRSHIYNLLYPLQSISSHRKICMDHQMEVLSSVSQMLLCTNKSLDESSCSVFNHFWQEKWQDNVTLCFNCKNEMCRDKSKSSKCWICLACNLTW